MLDSMPIHDAVNGQMIRGRQPTDFLDPRGVYHIQHIRDGAILAEFDIKNAVTNQAKNDLLNVYFNSTSHTTGWYIGLIDNNAFTATSAADTITGTHSGWVEYTNYTVAGGSGIHRGAWGQGSASGQQATNSSPVVFTFATSPGAVWGIFVVGDISKTGTTGILWSTAAFNAVLPVQVGDVLNVTYTIQL